MRGLLLITFIALLPSPSLAQWVQLYSPEPAANARYGWAVVQGPDYLAVSAPWEDRVYLHTVNESGFTYHSVLSVEAWELSASGDVLVTGNKTESTENGSVTIYRRTNDVWQFEQKLTPDDQDNNRKFGASISVSGETLVVGAPGENDGQGAAYIYRRGPSAWELVERISDAPVEATSSEFGKDVCLEQGYLAVGTPSQDSENSINAGKVYLYDIAPNSAAQLSSTLSLNVEADFFGNSVACVGDDKLFVGSGNPGSTSYQFELINGTWEQAENIPAGGSPVEGNDAWRIVGGGTVRLWRDDEAGIYASGLGNIVDDSHSKHNSGASVSTSWLVLGLPDRDYNDVSPGLDRAGLIQIANVSDYVRRSSLIHPPAGAQGLALDQIFEWSSDTDATSHRIQVSTDNSFSNTPIEFDDLESPEIAVEGLSSAQTYYWRVRSSNENWPGVWSPVYSFTTEFQVPPQLTSDEATVPEDGSVSIDVLSNDVDLDDDVLSIISLSEPSDGQAQITGQMIEYTPDPNFFGSDTFTYTVRDEYTHEESALVTVEVTPVPDAPIARDDTCDVPEDVLTECSVLDNDSDADGDILTLRVLLGPQNGSAQAVPTGVSYQGSENYAGPDSLQYEVNDGTGRVDSAWVHITVLPQNDPPVVQGESVTMLEDTETTIDVLANDSDVDGDELTIWSVDVPSGWSIVIGKRSSTHSLTIAPPANFYGVESIEYEVSDGSPTRVAGVVEVNVLPLNDPPTTPEMLFPGDGETVMVEGAPQDSLKIDWSESIDVDGDVLSYNYAVYVDGELTTTLLERTVTGPPIVLLIDEASRLLDGSGIVAPGGSLTLFQRLTVSDDSTTVSSDTTSFTAVRGSVTSNETLGAVPDQFTLGEVYPNPVRDKFIVTVGIPSSAGSNHGIELIGIDGRRVLRKALTLRNPGFQTVEFEVSGLAAGVYYLRAAHAGSADVHPVVIVR